MCYAVQTSAGKAFFLTVKVDADVWIDLAEKRDVPQIVGFGDRDLEARHRGRKPAAVSPRN